MGLKPVDPAPYDKARAVDILSEKFRLHVESALENEVHGTANVQVVFQAGRIYEMSITDDFSTRAERS